jgi:hypothetical protein
MLANQGSTTEGPKFFPPDAWRCPDGLQPQDLEASRVLVEKFIASPSSASSSTMIASPPYKGVNGAVPTTTKPHTSLTRRCVHSARLDPNAVSTDRKPRPMRAPPLNVSPAARARLLWLSPNIQHVMQTFFLDRGWQRDHLKARQSLSQCDVQTERSSVAVPASLFGGLR